MLIGDDPGKVNSMQYMGGQQRTAADVSRGRNHEAAKGHDDPLLGVYDDCPKTGLLTMSYAPSSTLTGFITSVRLHHALVYQTQLPRYDECLL